MKCPNQTHIAKPAALQWKQKKHQLRDASSQSVCIFKSILHRWWEIWFYSPYACPPYSHSQSILERLHKRKKETLDLWVYGEINLLFSQLITSKMHVYQLSVTLSFWWITCITALLPIWFVFLAVLITKLHCWCIGFLHARLMALMNKREQPTKPMDKKMLKKPQMEIAK